MSAAAEQPQDRPIALQGDLRNLPVALSALTLLPNWVVWRFEWVANKQGVGKWSKVPYQPRQPRVHARNNDDTTWGTYDEALAAFEAGGCDGIGFNLAGTEFGAFDIDNCRDKETGNIAPQARAVVDRAGSYCEVTVSGTGLRVIGYGTGPELHRQQPIPHSKIKIETYRGARRYIVVTGNPLPGAWPHICDIDTELDAVVAELDSNIIDFDAWKQTDDFKSKTAFLPRELVDLIERGEPTAGQTLSEAFHHAVCWLHDLGWSAQRIEELIADKPIVPERYKNRLAGEVNRSIGRAKPRSQQRSEARGESQSEEPKPLPQLRVINPADWQGVPVPERQWTVKNFIPANTTSLLTAGGGTGKSILAQQLGVARAAKRNWLSLPTTPGRTLILSAEDDAEEMHRRLDAIRVHYSVSFNDLGNMRLVDLVGEDAVLGALAKNGIVQATPLMDAVTRHVEHFKPDLVIVDALADAFAGDENNRGQARQFVSLLKRPARHYRCAFVCLAHPSLTGINTGTGSSGSTGWGNSMRSRMLFKSVEATDGGTSDPDLRTLTVNKTNYGPTGLSITLKWTDGVFAVQGGLGSLDRRAQENKADATFLDLLRMFNDQGQNVCANPGTTYAPARFAAHPNANGVGKRQFEAAMQRHLAYSRIRIEMAGPPSRLRSRLVVVEVDK